MSRLAEVSILVVMFVLRMGIPVMLTFVVGFFLHRLDAGWAARAKRSAVGSDAAGAVKRTRPPLPCWLIKGCSAEDYESCPAHQDQSVPCWLARLRVEGRIPRLCESCDLFRMPSGASVAGD